MVNCSLSLSLSSSSSSSSSSSLSLSLSSSSLFLLLLLLLLSLLLLLLSLSLLSLSYPSLGWLCVFSSFPRPCPWPPPPPQWLLLLTSKPFEINLRHLRQRKYIGLANVLDDLSVNYVSLTFDLTHDFGLWFFKVQLQNSCISGIIIWLMWNKKKQISKVLGWLYSLALWPHPWPCPCSFKVKVWNSFIWGMGRLIGMERKGCELINHNHGSDGVTMVGWVDVPDSDWSDLRRWRAVDISSYCQYCEYYYWDCIWDAWVKNKVAEPLCYIKEECIWLSNILITAKANLILLASWTCPSDSIYLSCAY